MAQPNTNFAFTSNASHDAASDDQNTSIHDGTSPLLFLPTELQYEVYSYLPTTKFSPILPKEARYMYNVFYSAYTLDSSILQTCRTAYVGMRDVLQRQECSKATMFVAVYTSTKSNCVKGSGVCSRGECSHWGSACRAMDVEAIKEALLLAHFLDTQLVRKQAHAENGITVPVSDRAINQPSRLLMNHIRQHEFPMRNGNDMTFPETAVQSHLRQFLRDMTLRLRQNSVFTFNYVLIDDPVCATTRYEFHQAFKSWTCPHPRPFEGSQSSSQIQFRSRFLLSPDLDAKRRRTLVNTILDEVKKCKLDEDGCTWTKDATKEQIRIMKELKDLS